MLTITKQADYGMLFLSHLIDKNNFVSLSEMVKKTKLPQRFLARIAAELVRNKLVISREGKVGGYKLIADLRKINLYDYLKIFEKDVALTKCVDPNYHCDYQDFCRQQNIFQHKLNQTIISEMKKIKLSQLLKKG